MHKHKEHKSKEHHQMIDNRMVKDDHQQGIKRVMQRGYDPKDCNGHHGKMGMSHGKESHFSRKGDSLTPRKA